MFHDWELGCRTNGEGEIRSLTWNEVRQLDIGYGYSADGETFPFRGRGDGLMPRIEEVFEAFPNGQFLVNFKSNDASEATVLSDVVAAVGAADQVWAVYGAEQAVQQYVESTTTRGFTDASIRSCLAEYTAPSEKDDASLPACQDTVVVVPLDLAPLVPGWPNDFADTMTKLGTDVIVSGPNLSGIDTIGELEQLPSQLNLYVWTNKVEALSERS